MDNKNQIATAELPFRFQLEVGHPLFHSVRSETLL
jgi:hypothetical protein